LLDLDADYDNGFSNANGQKPIHWACIKGRLDIVSILCKCKFNDLDQNRVLQFFEIFKVQNGIDINSQDARGYTPVLAACQYGHQGLVAFLVSRGAKLEIEDKMGDTCLHWAAYKGHPDLTRLLIIYGVYPKKIDTYGQTVLHMACLGGNLNIVQQLVEQDSIDTEIRDKKGNKAIDLARSAGHSEIVDLIDRHYKNRRNYKCNWK
jgi:ankyrin repeat protein